jgi:hypothetical protein
VQVRRAKLPRDHREDTEAHQDMKALRALLTNIVDYAGLYPPAGLDMTTAVLNYASYAESLDAWMLGRFIVPAARLGELEGEFARIDTTSTSAVRLMALCGASRPTSMRCGRSTLRTRRHFPSTRSRRSSRRRRQSIGGGAHRGEFELFEAPSAPTLDRRCGDGTGRTNANSHGRCRRIISSADDVVRFMRGASTPACASATAGLHHPLRANIPSHEASSPSGVMYGHRTSFAAAAIAHGLSDDDASDTREAIRVRSSR